MLKSIQKLCPTRLKLFNFRGALFLSVRKFDPTRLKFFNSRGAKSPPHGSSLRNEPCRQVRVLWTRTVAAFAVCNRISRESPVNKFPATLCLSCYAWLIANAQNKRNRLPGSLESDRRGSNSRPPPWQGGVLPTVLLSHLLNCLATRVAESDRRGSNSRPPPWQGGVLPTVLLSHL